MSDKSFEEANIFLEQYPDISEFDLLLPDMNAVLRGKRIQRKKLSSIFRSEEHTSELQSQAYLVCRLLLEKKHV